MFGSSDDEAGSSTQPAPKRSLFNRPAWAKPQVTESQNADEDVFSRSNRSYSKIIAEQERKKRENAEKKRVKLDRKSSGRTAVKQESSEGGTAKKRRITGEEVVSMLGELSPTPPAEQSASRDQSESRQPSESSRLRSLRSSGPQEFDDVRLSKNRTKPLDAVELGDSDGDEEEQPATIAPKEDADDESDDEFAELARQARERRKLQALQRGRTATPNLTTESARPGSGQAEVSGGGLPTPPPPDPTIQILVTSRIPKANPLIVQRKLSQRLLEIRTVWCQKQGFTAEQTAEVFFIYRMRRLYDVTTCKSLGLDVDADGNVVLKGSEDKDGVEKINLEAVTEEIFQQLKDGREREERAKINPQLAEEMAAAESAATAASDVQRHATQEASMLRLLLKAKGREDFKLKVKPVSAEWSPSRYRC